MNIAEQAALFARAAHGAIGQKRKFTGHVPYIVHPERVAQLVTEAQGTNEMRAAAWLHDVVEDTHITLGEIKWVFGSVIAEYVDWMTEDKVGFSSKKERKEYTCEKMKSAPYEVRVIKLSDIIANAEDLVLNYEQIKEISPEFPDRWINEQRNLFAVIGRDNHPLLHARANELLYGRFYEKELPTHTEPAFVP